MQTARRAGGPPSFELKPFNPERGLALLPKPDVGDLFYDIEGDPFYEEGLEYLHGVWFEEAGRGVFKDYWAHDRAQEGEASRCFPLSISRFWQVRWLNGTMRKHRSRQRQNRPLQVLLDPVPAVAAFSARSKEMATTSAALS